MRTVRIAFYKGHDGFREWMRKDVNGYSRVELIVNSKIYSITPRNGVQVIRKTYDKSKWDFYDIQVNNTFIMNKVQRFLDRQVGKPFDYFGATLGQYLGLGWQDENAWFDVELVVKFLQFCLIEEFMELNPSKININKLCEVLKTVGTKQK